MIDFLQKLAIDLLQYLALGALLTLIAFLWFSWEELAKRFHKWLRRSKVS